MAQVSFGKFAKRRNSTKQPGSLSDTRTVKLKESCSQDRPTFIVTGDDFNFNYCEWDGKYYFVDEVVSLHNNLSEVHCELDPLATYKSEILNTTAYILYDSTANTELPDNRLPLKTTKTVQVATAACPFVPDSGCYILSLTGAHDSTGVYKVNDAQLAALIDDVSYIENNIFDFGGITPPTAPGTTDLWDWIGYLADYLQYMIDCAVRPISQIFGSGNIPQNIRECVFIPFNRGTTGGPIPVYLGSFKTQQSLSKLATETVHDTATVNIPWQAADFRRRSPYTEVYLYLPYIGMVKLSSENLVGQTSLTVAYDLAMRNGSLICTVSSGGQIIGQYGGNVGVSVPVGVSNIPLPKVAGSIVAGAAAGGALGSALASGASTGAAAAGLAMSSIAFNESITPNYTSIGGLDGIASTAADQNITCYTVYHDTIAAPNQNLQVIGSPTMCSKQIGTLTGFCQCADAHVEAPATAGELDAIDSMLNSGFYIE